MIKLKINNKEIEVEEGTRLIHAARDMGIEVPTLPGKNVAMIFEKVNLFY